MTDDGHGLRARIGPVAELTPDNLKRLMLDMGSGPGWYTSADLYRWYVGMTREEELAPVTQRKFGAVLRELGYKSQIRRVASKPARCWLITNRAFRAGAFPGDPGDGGR